MGKTVTNCDSLGCIKIETIKILIITRALGFGEALEAIQTPKNGSNLRL
jgi:hypothetical protein